MKRMLSHTQAGYAITGLQITVCSLAEEVFSALLFPFFTVEEITGSL